MNQTGAAEPPVGWVRRIMFWHGWLGYESRFYVATLLAVLTSLLLIVARRTRSWLASRVGLGLLLVSLAVVASAVYGWYRIEATQWGAVVADGVVPRTGNGANYGPAFNQPVPGGTEFFVSEQRGDWLSIVIPRSRRWLGGVRPSRCLLTNSHAMMWRVDGFFGSSVIFTWWFRGSGNRSLAGICVQNPRSLVRLLGSSCHV